MKLQIHDKIMLLCSSLWAQCIVCAVLLLVFAELCILGQLSLIKAECLFYCKDKALILQ